MSRPTKASLRIQELDRGVLRSDMKTGDRVRIGGVVYSGQTRGDFGEFGTVETIRCAAVDVLIDGGDEIRTFAACCLFPIDQDVFPFASQSGESAMTCPQCHQPIDTSQPYDKGGRVGIFGLLTSPCHLGVCETMPTMELPPPCPVIRVPPEYVAELKQARSNAAKRAWEKRRRFRNEPSN